MQSHTLKPEGVSPIPKPRHTQLPPDVHAGSLLRVPAVAHAAGVCKSAIWTWCRQGKFPKPIKFGRITAWRAVDVAEWLADPAAWMASHAPKMEG